MRLSHLALDRAGPCPLMLESYGCPWWRSKQTHVGRGMYRDLLRSLFWYAACVFGNTARSQSAVAGQWPLISSIIIVPLTCPVASGASLPTYNTLSTSRLKSMCRRQYKRMRIHVLAADGEYVLWQTHLASLCRIWISYHGLAHLFYLRRIQNCRGSIPGTPVRLPSP
jgi:hypothetical protein